MLHVRPDAELSQQLIWSLSNALQAVCSSFYALMLHPAIFREAVSSKQYAVSSKQSPRILRVTC